MFFLFLLQANYLAINTADRNIPNPRLLADRDIEEGTRYQEKLECIKKVQKGIIIFLGASTMYTAGLYTAMFTQLNCPKCKQD